MHAVLWRGLPFVFLLSLIVCGLAGCGGDSESSPEQAQNSDDDQSPDDDDNDDQSPDDDDDNDDDDNDDNDNNDNDDDNDNDDTATEGTAWENMRRAEAHIADANFSVALTEYRVAIAKLTDDDPDNDGPVEPMDLARCRYGRALMQLIIALPLIEDFIGDFIGPKELTAELNAALGLETTDDIPTSLITVYLLEIILPMFDDLLADLEAPRAAEDFVYRLPPIRFVWFNHAIEIPGETVDGLGEHDRADAHLLAALCYELRATLHHVAAHDLDNGAMNIDYWLALLQNLDLLVQEMNRFPNFLGLHDAGDPDGIDGFALLAAAKRDTQRFINTLNDDNDGDGHFWLDDNDTPLNPFDDFIDPAEVGDDWLDALRLETDDQTDDIVRWQNGRLQLNVRIDGALVGAETNVLLNTFVALMSDATLTALSQSWFGADPPEAANEDGYDNDLAQGESTALSATTLTDLTAAWTPGALIGAVLNPNVNQPEEFEALQVFAITANTATTVTIAGDLTAVAEAGNIYSIGDGVADDQPMDLSLLVNLFAASYVPADAETGLFLAAIYDNSVSVRDILPRFDLAVGDPEFSYFVVDRTESFIDNNSNGIWDPGIDTLLDAAHSYGGQSYAPDGLYQPYYFFFAEPTFGGALIFGGGWEGVDPHDALNCLVSAFLVRLGKGGRP
jgi:hypothetical protein